MLRPIVKRGLGMLAFAFVALVVPLSLAAQTGTITGRVTAQDTGEPLATVQVYLQGTSRNTLSTSTGTFTITNVPPGTYTLVGQRIGYQEARTEGVVVGAGQTVNAALALRPQVLALQAVVATGLIDPVEGVRSPVSVARVSREMMPIATAGNAIQNIQGRVAGVQMNRGSGQPGSGTSIMLRTPTSLRGSGAPLIVVDGVILGGIISDPNTTSIEGMDIESIEIIRGAAAASLYGSRAAAGVINITTARGQGLQQGVTRFSARSEFGFQEAYTIDDLPSHHHYMMNATNTSYVDAEGRDTNRMGRIPENPQSAFQQFMDNPYPGPVYNNVLAVARPGQYQAHQFSVSQNTASTNFAASLTRTVEQGAVENNDGYYRNGVRLNLDHRFMNTMTLGMSMSYTRDGRDELATNPFQTALTAPRDVNLGAKDANGKFLQQPNPDVQLQNPLWTEEHRDESMKGNRALMSANYAWSPFSWLTANTVVSFDRRESTTRNYVAKGTPPNVGSEEELDGSISFAHTWTETWNAEAQASLRRDFGQLNTRVTFRGLMERDRTETGNRSGSNFILYGIPQISNTLPENRSSSSTEREVRATGYLVDTGFDYAGKYTATILGRRDGSSLFGPEARWRNYYRLAAAWRLAEEPWFNLPGVSEFKLSYARGTAGGRPGWDSQYETWNVTGGLPTKGQLGNKFLRPEHTTEQEVSLNAIVFEKYGIELTHAWQKTIDQIVPAPLPGYVGYGTQIVNSGAVSGHTTEFSIEANFIQRSNLGWNSIVIADYSSSKIDEWNLPCDASRTWRFDCQGEPVYGIYGFRLLENHDQLKNHRGGDAVPFGDQFQVNDEGYLVWVGDFDYTDGLVNGVVTPGTWGTNSPLIGGRTYSWGVPFFEEDETGATKRPSLGTGNSVNFGWLNNLRLGNFNFHAQLHASLGGVANNRAYQDLINNTNRNAPFMDQAGKPDGLKKPIGYYTAAVGSGGSTYITEDADYIKLRTLTVNYRLNQSHFERIGLGQLGVESVQLGITGRNIYTITSYSGYDPEQALNLNDRLNAVGTGNYPPTRTWTLEAALTF